MSSTLQSNVDNGIKVQIQEFLFVEATLLDNRKYREWLDLLEDDIVYRMPLRETREGVGAANIVENMSFFDETKLSLGTRANRLYTKSAWVENPAPRQRHFISNIVVEGTSRQNEYKVKSYFLFKRSRASDINTEEMFGERHDIIRNVNGEWKIASRTIYADQAVLTTMNLSMFL